MGGEIGSIMGAFKGPEDPGIQATVSGGGSGYTPTSHAGELEMGGMGSSAPPGATITPGRGTAGAGNDDSLKQLSNQLAFANSVAGTARGIASDLNRGGPSASPLAGRPAGAAGPYQPTALRLSDILGRR
jgi:hypothetical protein